MSKKQIEKELQSLNECIEISQKIDTKLRDWIFRLEARIDTLELLVSMPVEEAQSE